MVKITTIYRKTKRAYYKEFYFDCKEFLRLKVLYWIKASCGFQF